MNLVQFNVAWMRWSFTDPRWNSFKDRLKEVHEAAERHPGFIRRMKGEYTPLGYLTTTDDSLVMGNLSMWRSLEDLHEFTFSEPHMSLLRDKRKWFHPPKRSPYSIMYWDNCLRLDWAWDHLIHGNLFGVLTWKDLK